MASCKPSSELDYNINPKYSKYYKLFEDKEIEGGIDILAVANFNHHVKCTDPEDALRVIVNSVEGDASQLPSRLAKYAEKKGWMEGF